MENLTPEYLNQLKNTTQAIENLSTVCNLLEEIDGIQDKDLIQIGEMQSHCKDLMAKLFKEAQSENTLNKIYNSELQAKVYL